MVFRASDALSKQYGIEISQKFSVPLNNPLGAGAIVVRSWRSDADAGGLVGAVIQHGNEGVIRLRCQHQKSHTIAGRNGEVSHRDRVALIWKPLRPCAVNDAI